MIDLVDEALKAVLRDHWFPPELDKPKVEIAALDELPVDTDVWIGLFPYAVIETPALKNERDEWTGHERTRKPPLALDVYYLLTAHGKGTGNAVERSKHLARAMRLLHDHGRLRIEVPGNGRLPPQQFEVHVTLNPISVEDMTRLWSAFPQRPLRPSVSYLVTPVPVLPDEDTAIHRVKERRLSSAVLLPEVEV